MRPPRAFKNTASLSAARRDRTARRREAAVAQVGADNPPGVASDRHDAFFVAFSEDADDTVGEVDVGELEADGFADADTGGVQRFEQRAVSLRERTVAGHRAEELVDLCFVERFGDPLRDAGCVDVFARIGRKESFGGAKTVERPDRDQCTCDRRRREEPVSVVVGEGGEIPDVRLHGGFADRGRVGFAPVA